MRRILTRKSVRGRLLMLAVGVEFVMLALLVGNSLRLLQGAMTDQARWHAQMIMPVMNAALTAPLAQRDYATVQAVLNESRATAGIDYVVVTDRDGDVVASSGWVKGQKLPKPDRVIHLSGFSTLKRYNDVLSIEQSGQKLGTLHLGLDLSRIISARRLLLTQGIGIAAIELILSSLILLLIGYWLTRHLSSLTKASLEVASGNLTPAAVHESDDEIGRLGMAFNKMAGATAERVNDLIAAKVAAEASERAKSESEDRLRSITDSAHDAILMMDPRGDISYWNPAATEILGYTREEALGKNLHELLAPERYLPDYRAAFPEFHRSGTGKVVGNTFELSARRKDGQEVIISLSLSAVRMTDGWHAVGILRDITEMKRIAKELSDKTIMLEREIHDRRIAQEELAVKQGELLALNQSLQERVDRAIAELRRKDQALISQGRQAAMGEMIHNIAHQWRQPLNTLSVLMGNIQFAYMDNTLSPEYLDESAATANRLIQKMSTTINDFRNFFSPDKGIETFSAMVQVKQAVALVEAALKNSNVTVEVMSGQDCILKGFPNEYSQVLLNLLGNARDAIMSKGTGAGSIAIHIRQLNGMGVVTVADNGGGIPEHAMEKIFEPYFSTKSKGSGIGLYMSKMIIERNMNGIISARNANGGAEITVSVPIEERQS